ncbi:hypothetical protein FB451DRAFT_1100774 [Mycena latifolia]|nr:hypothetical protein FB451DRAFT_1100774 [Mycena latifolia]
MDPATLADADAVFPTSTTTGKARTIHRPAHLLGFPILDGRRGMSIGIQPSVASFRRTFERMSHGLLKNLDWGNILVAGVIVLGTLLAIDVPPGQPHPADQWMSSDIDIYIYGLGPRAANAKIRQLFSTFKANLPRGTPNLVVRNSKTITFYARYPLRRIQIVLKLVKSPRAVLLNFDLDICAMGWDDREVWILPRAARALETGFNVFTMNLIQGHYLSERRATQEQKVFKYANKGYGIRILPSYISSLEESKTHLQDIAKMEELFALDIDAIAAASRAWTKTLVTEARTYPGKERSFSHLDLENRHQASSEPLGRSCLTGLSLFMRHVALWEMEQRDELVYVLIPALLPVLSYDDIPSYTWGECFNVSDFAHEIDCFNLRQITDWLEADWKLPRFTSAARVTYGPTVGKVLDRAQDIVMPLLLPCNFAAFANWLVGEAQAAAGLPVEKILRPAVPSQKHLVVDSESSDTTQGIFLWRIGRELMWQQLDRRIDETFEALYVFYRANDRTHGGWQDLRLITQLSKRAIRPTVEDELAAFARWVGRRPIFVDWFYNRADNLDTRGEI